MVPLSTKSAATAAGTQAPSPRNASLRRQRREVKTTGTGALVPVVEPSPTSDPDHPDARRWLPLRRAGASVPVKGLAVVVSELHPFDGVGRGLPRAPPSPPAPAPRANSLRQFRPGSSTYLRTFYGTGESAKKTMEKPRWTRG